MASVFTEAKAHDLRVNASHISGLLLVITLGVLLAAYPLYSVLALTGVVCLISVAFLLTRLVRRYNLRVWQVLVLAALSGFCILNYGFENIAFRLGVPIPLGHVLMFVALGLAIRSYPGRISEALGEPALLCILALFPLTFAHLFYDVPRYGFYAVRDASIVFEGIFLLLGLLWAADRRNTAALVKCLLFLFIVNLLYAYTYPWGERLASWSPTSGIFLQVPILGSYNSTARYLVQGGLFCLWIAGYVVRWPRWVLYVLAVVQFFGLAIHQVRSTYVDIAVCLILLVLLGETRKWASLVVTFVLGLALLLVMTPALAQLSGRVGPVDLAFLEKQAESSVGLFGNPAEHDPIEGSISDRQEWYKEVESRLNSGPRLLTGVGFGQVLIDFYFAGKGKREAVAVRQPHNSHLTILARLGVLGLIIWGLCHFFILKRFLHFFRERRRFPKPFRDLILWLFLFYVSTMIHAFVQPELEFSSSAIPFYFMVGFALGLMRWQAPRAVLDRAEATYSAAAVAN